VTSRQQTGANDSRLDSEDFSATLAVSRELPCEGVYSTGISGFLPVGGSWATDDSLSPLRERFQLRVANYKKLASFCQPRVILFLARIFERKRANRTSDTPAYRLEGARNSNSRFRSSRPFLGEGGIYYPLALRCQRHCTLNPKNSPLAGKGLPMHGFPPPYPAFPEQ
jgi:hypothetical protein